MDETLDALSASPGAPELKYIQLQVDHDVARIALNRPEASNALSLATLEEVDYAVSTLELNESVKVVVFSGSDKAFSSGLDIAEHTDEKAGYKHVETVSGRFERRLALPAEIDADAVTARSKNGVITITLPKRPEAQSPTRTIPVSTG